MSEVKKQPIANIDDVDALERTLKEMWAGASTEQILVTTATLDHFHHEKFGCKWNGLDTGWLFEYLVVKRRQPVDSLLDMTIVEMAAILREDDKHLRNGKIIPPTQNGTSGSTTNS